MFCKSLRGVETVIPKKHRAIEESKDNALGLQQRQMKWSGQALAKNLFLVVTAAICAEACVPTLDRLQYFLLPPPLLPQ